MIYSIYFTFMTLWKKYIFYLKHFFVLSKPNKIHFAVKYDILRFLMFFEIYI